MTRLVFDLDQLAGAVDRMRRFQQHLLSTHDAVDARMRGLHVEWTGDAAVAQAAAQQQWVSAAREVHDALDALQSIVSSAHANYRAATSTNQRMWAR